MNWLRYPRTGTALLDGEWLCTIDAGRGKVTVAILNLGRGLWCRPGGDFLTSCERVTAVAHVPAPYLGDEVDSFISATAARRGSMLRKDRAAIAHAGGAA